MKRISIIIGFTPYHAYAASQIIAQLDGVIYCAFTKSWPTTNKPYVRIGLPEDCSIPGKAVLSFLHFAFLVHRLTFTRKPFDVYIPHPGHILSNHLFFSKSPKKRVLLYEDGLLNYYDATVKNPFVGRTKKLLARACGLRYRNYIGHLAGYDAGQYDGAYLSMPDRAVRKECLGTLQRLHFPTHPFKLKKKTILFLDQDVSTILAPEEREACLAEMLERYPQKDYSYYYKAHHDHASQLSERMTELASSLKSLPAEMLIERLRPSHVISFFSSALINIKNSWPEVECVSLAATHIIITRDGKQCSLGELFEEMGVICF